MSPADREMDLAERLHIVCSFRNLPKTFTPDPRQAAYLLGFRYAIDPLAIYLNRFDN